MVKKQKKEGIGLEVPEYISSSKKLLPPQKSVLRLLAPEKKSSLKKLGSVPSPPKKISLRAVPSPEEELPSLSEFENTKKKKDSLQETFPSLHIEEKTPFFSRLKEKFSSRGLSPVSSEIPASFDVLDVEHALFAENDYYGLRKKNVFPRMSKKSSVEKIVPELVPFPPSESLKKVLKESGLSELEVKKEPHPTLPLEEKPSFVSRMKEKLLSKKVSSPETASSFDFLRAEHALFAESDFYHLRRKNVVPTIRTIAVPKKNLIISEEDSLFKEDKELYFPGLSVPKKSSFEKIPVSIPDSRALTLEIPQRIAPGKSSFQVLSEMDPMKKSMELVGKCQKALQNKNYDFAVLYSEELVPFYKKLSSEQQKLLSDYIEDVEQRIQMLYLDKVHDRLKKVY